jgi:hypothetical protein
VLRVPWGSARSGLLAWTRNAGTLWPRFVSVPDDPAGVPRGSRIVVTAMQWPIGTSGEDALRLSAMLGSPTTRRSGAGSFARSVLYLRRMNWQLSLGDMRRGRYASVLFHNPTRVIEGGPSAIPRGGGDLDGMLAVYGPLLQAEAIALAGRSGSACDLARGFRLSYGRTPSPLLPSSCCARIGQMKSCPS